MTAAECFEDNGANWSWDDRVGLGPADSRKPLTSRQREVLEIIRKDERVTYREICEALGVQPNAAHGHVAALVSKGYILNRPGTARSFRLIPQPEAADAQA